MAPGWSPSRLRSGPPTWTRRGRTGRRGAAVHSGGAPSWVGGAQQRGLGAVPDPVLGDAAAAVGMPGRARDLRGLAVRAVHARGKGPDRAGSAPAVRGRDHVRLPSLRETRAAGA